MRPAVDVAFFHYVLARWDLPSDHYRALVGDLSSRVATPADMEEGAVRGPVDAMGHGSRRPILLTGEESQRVRDVLAIHGALLPLRAGPAAVALLRHPGTGPSGVGSALDTMCAGPEGLSAVASSFARLPAAPLFLPGVLCSLVRHRLVEPATVAQAVMTALGQASPLEHARAALPPLEGCDVALRETAVPFQRAVLMAVLASATCTPQIVAWTARVLARARDHRALCGGAIHAGARAAACGAAHAGSA